MNRDTTHPKFPHHWDCQYLTGHPENKICCIISDGTTREPDGSIAVKSQIQEGKSVFVVTGVPSGEKRTYDEDNGWVKRDFNKII